MPGEFPQEPTPSSQPTPTPVAAAAASPISSPASVPSASAAASPNPIPASPAGGSQTPVPTDLAGQIRSATAGQNPPGFDPTSLGQPGGFGDQTSQNTAVSTQPAAPTLPPEVQQKLAELEQMRAQLQQFQPLIQHGYQAWVAEQQERHRRSLAEQQAANRPKPWFNLPAFDKTLASLVERDPGTGELRAKPGAPPDAVARYTQFSQALADLQLEFWQNPEKVLGDPIREMVRQEAQTLVQQHLGGFQEQTQARDLIRASAGWMLEQDQQTGQPKLTAMGQAYRGYVQVLEQAGMRGTQAIHDAAVRMVQGDVLAARARQQGHQPAADAGKQQFLAAAQPAPPQPAATPPNFGGQIANGQPSAPPLAGRGPSLRDMLRGEADRNGITDKTLSAMQVA